MPSISSLSQKNTNLHLKKQLEGIFLMTIWFNRAVSFHQCTLVYKPDQVADHPALQETSVAVLCTQFICVTTDLAGREGLLEQFPQSLRTL